MEVCLSNVLLGDVQRYIKQQFTPVAAQKELEFHIEMDNDVPLVSFPTAVSMLVKDNY